MKIEIAEPGRMTQTGSSLLKLIQNNNMPVLDLLVRESIQNSLDARKEDSKYVEVDYITGQFASDKLSAELEGITEPLKYKYPLEKYDFLAIKDSNTVGLTGEMDYKKVKNNEYGNLLKLIYEICKPQEAEGAGGSWGLGKTVYFRIGMGLVIYYSRIKNEQGQYESRLAASFVENETKTDAMIPVYKGQTKRGIAWWGESVEENVTQPISNETYITRFLGIFGVEKYQGEETGTTIIIPFINAEQLLSNNQIEYLDGKEEALIPYWCHKLEDYLTIAVQRWYAPRLNNKFYTNGAFLRTKINQVGIAYDSMEPVFKVIQALYNRANHVKENDILDVDGVVSKASEIRVLKYLTDQVVGLIAYTKVSRELLQMNPPYNKPEPYMFFNCEKRDDDVNKPTICFTRKPGMIVSFENVGPWASNIQPTNKDEYILGIFVLNSWNELRNSPFESSLEEYVRRSEMADHTSWSDWSEGKFNPRIITKIQNNVNKIINKEFAQTDENPQPRVNSGLGKLFGEMLLPPDGFGKKPNSGGTGGTDKNIVKRKSFSFEVEANNIKYLSDSMIIPIVLVTTGKKKLSKTGFDMIIDSESNKITVDEWENKMGLDTPFEIRECKIEVESLDGEAIGESVYMPADESKFVTQDLTFSEKCTTSGTCHGIHLEAEEPHSMVLKFILTVSLSRKDIKPSFAFEKEDEKYGK